MKGSKDAATQDGNTRKITCKTALKENNRNIVSKKTGRVRFRVRVWVRVRVEIRKIYISMM